MPANTAIKNYGPDALISAGFLDSHVHFAQTPMIAAFGEQLLDWLNKYTFPTERKYADKAFASSVAKIFLQECLRNGITTSCVYATVFPQSVDALFEQAERLGVRMADICLTPTYSVHASISVCRWPARGGAAPRKVSRSRGIYGGSENPFGVSPECFAAEELALFKSGNIRKE